MGQPLISVIYQAALGGFGVAGDVGSSLALAGSRAVDVKFGDVDRQAKRLQLRQRTVLSLETWR